MKTQSLLLLILALNVSPTLAQGSETVKLEWKLKAGDEFQFKIPSILDANTRYQARLSGTLEIKRVSDPMRSMARLGGAARGSRRRSQATAVMFVSCHERWAALKKPHEHV
jgi:hypothetical protein